MSKTKKSKLLASMLCATVVAGLYASPVMAATGLTLGGGDVVAASEVTINGVTLASNKVTARYGDFTSSITVGGNTLTGATVSKVNNLFDKNATTKSIIYAGNGSQIGGVTFNNGAVTGVTSLTATGTITGKGITSNGGNLYVKDTNGTTNFTVTTAGAVTANGKLTAKGGSSITYTSGNTTATSTVGSTIVNNIVGKDAKDNNYTANSTTAYNSISDKLTVKDSNGDSVATVSRAMTSAGLVDSFAGSDGKTHTITTNAKGTTFGGTGATGTTVINGGSITTGSLTVGGMEIKAGATSGTVEIGGITLKKDTATGGLAVDALDIENVTLNKNGFKLDATNAANGFAVEGASGALKVKDIPGSAGSSTMVYTTAKDGTNTMWLDTATGNLSTVGTVSIGGELGGTAKVVIDGETGSIKVGNELFAVDGTNGNAKLEGELIVNNGLVAGTDGSGTFKVKNIDGNTMAYMVDKDGNYTVGINAQNGNIETKGALAVTNAEGNNVFTANSNGMSVGNGNFAVNAATGDTKIAGGLNVGTNVEVAGGITASSLTLGEMNVGDAITDLQGEIGNVGGDLTTLTGRVENVENRTTDINYIDYGDGSGVTEIGNGVFAVSSEGFVTINQGMFTVDRESGSVTMGSQISMDTNTGLINASNFQTSKGYDLNSVGEAIENLEGSFGKTNENVAGIEREAVTDEFGTVNTTTIEGTLKVSDNGLISNADGSFIVDSNGGLSAGAGTFAADITGIRMSAPVQMTLQGGSNYKGESVIDLGSVISDIDDRLDVLEDKTQNITGSGEPGNVGEGGNQIEVPPTTGGETGINGDVTVGGNLTAGSGTIGGVTMEGGKVTAGEGSFGSVNVGGENGTNITGDKITIGNTNPDEDADDKSSTVIEKGDVTVTDKEGNQHSIMGNAQDIADIREDMGAMSNRISKVEDRIDKVGAMSAAIANLRTMGYDPTAPTEIAVGIGQYRSETGAALGLFHYPNRDFMLSLSVSTSGDEVMGGIGATWKFGRKTPEQMLAAEKEKAAKAKLAKAEAMKKAAAEAKVAEQQAKHAKMAAEKAAK